MAWLALGFTLSAISIGLIARAIDPDRLALALRGVRLGLGRRRAHPHARHLSLPGSSAGSFCCVRWPFDHTAVLRALLTGQLLNHLLPIRVGDVVRSILLGREPGGSFARVFGSVLIEKAWDWLALCVLMLIVTWAAPLPDWFLAPARSIGLLAALVLIGFVAESHYPGTLDSARAGQTRSGVGRTAGALALVRAEKLAAPARQPDGSAAA